MVDSIYEKLTIAQDKLNRALEFSCPALQLGGVAATDARFARVATNAGVKILEPNHTAISCVGAYHGFTSMRDAYLYKHELNLEEVLKVLRALRRAVPQEVFILCAAPGTFDEPDPLFDITQARLVSDAGADAIFLEKNNYDDVERLVDVAHHAGLLVQASFQFHADNINPAVIPVESHKAAGQAARRLEDMGVDIVAMRLSGIFMGNSATGLGAEEFECILAMVRDVKVATCVYAGINMINLSTISRTGVKMIGVASAVDDLLFRTLAETITSYQFKGV